MEINYLKLEKQCGEFRHQYTDAHFQEVVNAAETFDGAAKENLCKLLKSYSDVFSETPGRTNVYEHEILLHDEKPFFKASYPIPLAYRSEVKRQIDEMVKQKVIEEAQTEYVSPLTVVKKKRWCSSSMFRCQTPKQAHGKGPSSSLVYR